MRMIGALLALAVATPAWAQDDDRGFLGIHEADLRIGTADGKFEVLFSGVFDLEVYLTQDRAPGLLFENDSFVTPRLKLYADATLGEDWTAFVQVRADQGFDPKSEDGLDVRLDEAFLRHTGRTGAWMHTGQIGKFATPLGAWIDWHESFESVFIRNPLPYDHVTSLHDFDAIRDNGVLVGMRDLPDAPANWIPVIWGPVFATGLMATAMCEATEIRVAVTNSAPSERPEEWTWSSGDARRLVPAVRVSRRLAAGLKVAANWSAGPYLRPTAEDTLAPGRDLEEYVQTLVGLDAEYGIGVFEFFAEVWRSAWDVPNVTGRPASTTWYLQGQYSLRPGLKVGLRYGEIAASEVLGPSGSKTPWDRTHRRLEVAAAWKIHVNLQARLQYELNHTNGDDPDDNLLSAAMSLSW